MYLIRIKYYKSFVASWDREGIVHTRDLDKAICFSTLIEAQAFCFALNSSLDLENYYLIYKVT